MVIHMIDKLFLQILNNSFTSSIVIILVILIRFLLKKAPKIFSYLLWGVVLFRLLIPFSFESMWSLIPVTRQPVPKTIITSANPHEWRIDSGVEIIDNTINPMLYETSPTAMHSNFSLLSIVWMIGTIIMILYSFVSLFYVHRKLIGAVRLKENIYLADQIVTPFVIGIFRPKIYLPSNLMEQEQDYIILHEQTHIRRFDHITKILAFTALCLYWFHPFVWIAFLLAVKDMEMSCDESVLKQIGEEIRCDYSASLLSLATGKRIISAAPLAFGEGDTKTRIKNVMNYKKPAFFVMIIIAIALIMIAAGMLLDPQHSATTTALYKDEHSMIHAKIPSDWSYKIIKSTQKTFSPDVGIYIRINNEEENYIFIYRASGYNLGVNGVNSEKFQTKKGLTGYLYKYTHNSNIEMKIILDCIKNKNDYSIIRRHGMVYGIKMKSNEMVYQEYADQIETILQSIEINDIPEEGITLTGFIADFDTPKTNTFQFDQVEYLETKDDSERIQQLELDEERDMPSGYYIYNSEIDFKTLQVTKDTIYSFIDWNDRFVTENEDLTGRDKSYSTKDKEKFMAYLSPYNPPYKDRTPPVPPYIVHIKDGTTVTEITEIIVN